MSVQILTGDCREMLRTLPDESVHCVVTSPPYWGLRDYGTAIWDGGDTDCSHLVPAPGSTQNKGNNGKIGTPFRETCGMCGARRIDSQLGLERTLGEHVAVMVDVFREVRRVLRKDGTLWLNYGDAYAQTTMRHRHDTHKFDGRSKAYSYGLISNEFSTVGNGLKPKDLCGIPWRVAFALQADGWWLRSDIIWAKPNPMPERVSDRPTKAHEYLFLMTKAERYYYDAEAIREDAEYGRGTADPAGRMFNRVGSAEKNAERIGGAKGHTFEGGHNKRSVWEIATAPFSEAHFATFPPALIEPCIKAGTSERGCCAKCGAPWVRETTSIFTPQQDVSREKGIKGAFNQKPMDASNGWQGVPRGSTQHKTLGWSPSCFCETPTVPATVLDPFGGAGTTGLVADRLQRNAILIELNPEYAAMARRRIDGDAPLFSVAPSPLGSNTERSSVELGLQGVDEAL